MPNTLDVQNSVIPIVLLDSKGSVKMILGTGFFVGMRPVVVTAKHVFADNPLGENESYSLVILEPDGDIKLAKINDFLMCEAYDVAVIPAGTITSSVSLSLSRVPVPTNEDILTYEFSSTSIEQKLDRRYIHFMPFTHKGNAMRHYVSNFPESHPTPVLDTSFPALQGASGAPIIRSKDFVVVGMLVANHERHLIPAQTVHIKVDESETEETKYFLPTGKALEGAIIIDYLKSIDADYIDVP